MARVFSSTIVLTLVPQPGIEPTSVELHRTCGTFRRMLYWLSYTAAAKQHFLMKLGATHAKNEALLFNFVPGQRWRMSFCYCVINEIKNPVTSSPPKPISWPSVATEKRFKHTHPHPHTHTHTHTHTHKGTSTCTFWHTHTNTNTCTHTCGHWNQENQCQTESLIQWLLLFYLLRF